MSKRPKLSQQWSQSSSAGGQGGTTADKPLLTVVLGRTVPLRDTFANLFLIFLFSYTFEDVEARQRKGTFPVVLYRKKN